MLARNRKVISVGRDHYFHEPIAPIPEGQMMGAFLMAKVLALLTFPQLITEVQFA